MTKLIGISLLILGCFAAWTIGERLDTDALAMLLGVIFGMMAGVPAALIALAASRQRVDVYHHHEAETPAQLMAQNVRTPRIAVREAEVHVLPVAVHGRLEVGR